MIRRIINWITVLLLLLWSGLCVQAQSQSDVYFTVEAFPDLIKCLPAPPEKGSPAFQYDIQRYKWGKQQRKDAARADMACRDAVWSYEALLDELDQPFGMKVSAVETPAIWTVLVRSLRTVDPIRVAPKAWYHRTRPFVYFGERTLTGEDDELRGEGSYPSGHTIRSWLAALLLCEINPASADSVYSRAWAYGESRVIAGAHWQSDVDASRVAAGIGFARLQTNEQFRRDLDLAREEFVRLSLVKKPYLTVAELPDATRFLPAPPKEGSPEQLSDDAIYRDMRDHHRTGARAQQAIRDAATHIDSMALYYSEAFGTLLSQKTTPRTMHLLRRSIRTMRLSASAPKEAYMRRRPFVVYNEGTLIPEDEEEERNTGSYPSGHSVRGWGMALVLAALHPERQDELLSMGYEWGQSRVIAGYHWQSDVEASRLLASACFVRLMECPAFLEDLAAAREEVLTLLSPDSYSVPSGIRNSCRVFR